MIGRVIERSNTHPGDLGFVCAFEQSGQIVQKVHAAMAPIYPNRLRISLPPRLYFDSHYYRQGNIPILVKRFPRYGLCFKERED
jgi:hypothetical protein